MTATSIPPCVCRGGGAGRRYAVAAGRRCGRQFAWMRWPVETWRPRAVVPAGDPTADHARVAIQLLSGDVPRRTVYGHTGWRRSATAGTICTPAGRSGRMAWPLASRLPCPTRWPCCVAEPPEGADLAAAVRASLAVLDGLAPDRIVFPLLGAVYRAALGEPRPHRLRVAPGRSARRRQERVSGPVPAAFRRRP